MKLHVNYKQSFHLGNNVPESIVFSNVIPEIKGEASAKKTIKNKAKQFVNKMSPLHWYDGVWDDLDFKI